MDLSGSEIASAVAVDVENSDQNKVVFTDEQITTNILSIAQLAVDGSIPVLDAVTKLKQILTEVMAIGMTKDKWKSLYASVIWILGTQISPTSQEEEHPRKNFIDLVKDSIAHDLADSSLLKATLELSTLVLLGLIKDEEGHQKRLIKLNTGVVYKQQKYNLEREETEGYSKLVVLLQSMPLPPFNIDSIIQSVLAVIGQFDLEPNRVLDVILDCFEQQPHNLSFIALLKQFKIANIVHIVGFKFTHYQITGKESSNKHAAGFEIVPESLCLLAATLIAQQLVDLDSLLPYLTPSLEETALSLKMKEDVVRKNLASISGLNEFLSNSGSPGNSLDATTPAASTVAPTEQPGYTMGPNLPTDAFFLQQPLRQRAGSSYKRVSNSKLLPNPPANASTGLLKSVLSSKLITVTSSSNVGAAATPTANTPSLGISRAQRDKDKETKEKERIQELEVEEKDLSGQLLLFDRSQMYATDDADVRRYPVLTLATCLLQVRCLSLAQTLIRSLSAESGVTLDFLMVFSKGLRDSMVSLAQYVVQPVVNELRRLPCLGGRQNSFITNRVEFTGNPVLVSTLTDTSSLPELLESFLKPMSYHIATSTQMFISLATLFKQFIEQHREKLWSYAEKRERELNLPDSEETNSFATVNNMAQQLLLALSTTGADATFASGQLWRGLSLLPHTLRFAIYDEHRRVLLQALNSSSANIQNMPLGVVLAAKIANKDIKNELKRLTKDNPKPTSIKLAKLLQSHSVIASTAFLSLVENFDNFIPYCIDALRTLSEGARDIFAHAFLTELSEKESQRNDAEASQEGRSSPSWFLSLAKFIACFYGRYPSTELRGLLSYMLQSLADGRVGDLILVKELVSVMGGCEVLRELSTVQLEGLAGGKVLRAEVLGVLGATSAVTPAGASAGVLLSQQRRAATTLRDTLLNTQTALPLFLFMARLRAKAITDEGIDQLKVASSLADAAQDLLLQLSDFLVLDAHGSNSSNNNSNNTNSNTSTRKTLENVAKSLPPVPTLLNDLQLSPNLAFQLVRPLFRHSLSLQNIGVVGAQQSWTLFSEEVRLSLIAWLDTQYNTLFGGDFDETEDENAIDDDAVADTEVSELDKQWKKEVRRWWQWTDKGENDLLKLYLWFWGLGLSDIHHPQDRYNAELKRIQDKLNDLETKKQNASAATLNLSSSEFKKWQKQRDTEMLPLKNAIVGLTDESQYQKTHVETMVRMLCEGKERFIPHTWQERNQPTHIANWLLQELVLPRVTLGASEAVYAIKFLRNLHDCGVQGVHILCVVDALLYRLLSLVYCCTEHEASCIGYALQEIWLFVTRWQRSMQLYDTEVKGKLAICCPSLVPPPLSATSSSTQSTAQNHSKSATAVSMSETDRHVLVLQAGVSYTKFLSLCRLWQSLLLQTLLTCLSTTEYMYIRCGMTLVSRLVEQFPSKRSDGQMLLATVEKLAAQDEKKDLQLMARSLAVRLKKQSSNWANDTPQAASASSAASTDKKLKPSASQTIPPSTSTSQIANVNNTNKNVNNSSNRNSSLSNVKPNNNNNNNRINNDSKVSSVSASKPPPPPPASANSNSNTSGLSLKDRLNGNSNNNHNNNLSGNKRDRDNNNNRDNKNANNANNFSSNNNNRDRDYRGSRDSRNRDNVNNSATPATKDTDNKDRDSVSLVRETGNKRKADDNNASNTNSNNNISVTASAANTGNKVARTELDKDVRSKQDREKTNNVNNNGATNSNNANLSSKTTSNSTTASKTSTAPVNPPRPQAMRGNSQSREVPNSNNSRNNTNASSRNNNINVRNSGNSSVNQPPPPPANPPPPPRQSSAPNNSYNNHRDNFSRDNRAQPPPPPNRDHRGASDHYNAPQQPPPPKQQPPSHQQYHQQQSQQSSNMSGYPPNKRTRR